MYCLAVDCGTADSCSTTDATIGLANSAGNSRLHNFEMMVVTKLWSFGPAGRPLLSQHEQGMTLTPFVPVPGTVLITTVRMAPMVALGWCMQVGVVMALDCVAALLPPLLDLMAVALMPRSQCNPGCVADTGR